MMKVFVHTSTRDVRLFAALSSMGIPWTGEVAAVDEKERVWNFGEVSNCGKWKTSELLQWWKDSTFYASNAAHPFQVVKACMANGFAIKRYIKIGGGIMQRKVGDSFVIEHVGDGVELGATIRATDDVLFACALSAVGFRVWASKSPGERRLFGIGESSETRGYTYEQVRHWWLDKGFVDANGQHPFAYAKAVAQNYHGAVKAMMKDRSLVEWRPPGSIGRAFIHPDCSSYTESLIAARLKPD